MLHFHTSFYGLAIILQSNFDTSYLPIIYIRECGSTPYVARVDRTIVQFNNTG